MDLYTVDDLINDESIGEVEHFKTGCANFDSLTGGILKGAVTVFAAPTGNGKSLVSAHLASALSKEHIILYLTFDNNNKTEKLRFRQIFEHKLYGVCPQNIIYPKEEMTKIKSLPVLIEFLKELQKENVFDIIFLDGLDKLSIEKREGEENGATLHQDGNLLIEQLIDVVNVNDNACIIMTWQLKSGCKIKDVYSVTSDDCAKSIGIARYAEEFFIVKKDLDKNHRLCRWAIKIDKARNAEDNKMIEIRSKNTIINLDKSDLDEAKNTINDLSETLHMKG